jgi:hypothetical protein
MIAAAPGFPGVETPPGWTREVKGPRVWLVPPTSGGRIVIAPLQGRPTWLHPDVFLERVLVQERERFPKLKQTDLVPVTSAHHVPGLVVDVAALDAADQPTEWRTYALFATDSLFALLFLQSAPHRFEELRPVFLEHAFRIVLPDGDAPAPVEEAPFEVDL